MPEETGTGERTVAQRAAEDHRIRLINRIVLIGVLVAIGSLIPYGQYYFQQGIWQALIDTGGLLVAIVGMGLAYRTAHRGKPETAGHVLLLTLIITYTMSELAWSGLTVSSTIGGVLLILLVGYLTLRQRWIVWVSAAGVYGLCVLLINAIQPPFRYDLSQLEDLYYSELGVTALLILIALWLIVRAAFRQSIRARLLVSFVLMALFLAGALSAVSAFQGFESGRERAANNLQVVATVKETQIRDWVGELQSDLASVLRERLDTSGTGSVESEPVSYLRAMLTVKAGYMVDQFRDSSRIALNRAIQQTRRLDEIYVIDTEGMVVLSTGFEREGTNLYYKPYFQRGLEEPYVQPPIEDLVSEQTSVIVVQPIASQTGEVLGVLAGRTSMATVKEIVADPTGLGETGESYLVSRRNNALLTKARAAGLGSRVNSEGALLSLEYRANGQGLYENYAEKPVVGIYHYIPELQATMLVEQEMSEVLEPVIQTLRNDIGVALAAVALAVGSSLLITRSIANPLGNLSETATEIAAGNLEHTARVEREDEIGSLAQAFNSMTARLRDLIGSLEARVADRTRDLEQRSAYLEASAQVARAVSSILDPDRLIQQVVDLICDRFDLYYVGLFLVDNTGEWAILQAGTGEAGRVMVERGHRIHAGEGMIGWSIANAQSRIALDTGQDTVRLTTSELPLTRSEAALPLRSRGQVLGALSVQSDRPEAFDQDTLVMFETMTDQVAIALDNARLLAESRQALEATGRAYGELSREAWATLLQTRPDLAFQSGERGVTSAQDTWRPEMKQALQSGEAARGDGAEKGKAHPLAVPIKVRGETIGVLDTYKPGETNDWMPEELALLETLADQVGQALEGARLYHETQRRVAREQLTGEIVNRMRRAVDMEMLMQTTIREMAAALGVSDAFVQLSVSPRQQGVGEESILSDIVEINGGKK